MTQPQVKASLALWRRRYSYRRGRLEAARREAHANHSIVTTEEAKLIHHWEASASLAKAMIARREKQLRKGASHTVSNRGISFVAAFEGFRSCPYQDSVGVWTIGYGETLGVTHSTPCVTQSYAKGQLKKRINADYLAPVLAYCHKVGFEPTQNEVDALASLAYNLGPGIFKKGTSIGNAIANHDRHAVADAFLVYNKAGSPPRVLPGLDNRRKAERANFLRG